MKPRTFVKTELVKVKSLIRICPQCKRPIKSVTESQLDYNFETHIAMHERGEVE